MAPGLRNPHGNASSQELLPLALRLRAILTPMVLALETGPVVFQPTKTTVHWIQALKLPLSATAPLPAHQVVGKV